MALPSPFLRIGVPHIEFRHLLSTELAQKEDFKEVAVRIAVGQTVVHCTPTQTCLAASPTMVWTTPVEVEVSIDNPQAFWFALWDPHSDRPHRMFSVDLAALFLEQGSPPDTVQDVWVPLKPNGHASGEVLTGPAPPPSVPCLHVGAVWISDQRVEEDTPKALAPGEGPKCVEVTLVQGSVESKEQELVSLFQTWSALRLRRTGESASEAEDADFTFSTLPQSGSAPQWLETFRVPVWDENREDLVVALSTLMAGFAKRKGEQEEGEEGEEEPEDPVGTGRVIVPLRDLPRDTRIEVQRTIPYEMVGEAPASAPASGNLKFLVTARGFGRDPGPSYQSAPALDPSSTEKPSDHTGMKPSMVAEIREGHHLRTAFLPDDYTGPPPEFYVETQMDASVAAATPLSTGDPVEWNEQCVLPVYDHRYSRIYFSLFMHANGTTTNVASHTFHLAAHQSSLWPKSKGVPAPNPMLDLFLPLHSLSVAENGTKIYTAGSNQKLSRAVPLLHVVLRPQHFSPAPPPPTPGRELPQLLRVNVKSGKDLVGNHMGPTEVMCEVQVGHTVYRTNPKAGTSPIWDEGFVFPVDVIFDEMHRSGLIPSKEPAHGSLVLRIFMISHPDGPATGRYSLALDSLMLNKPLTLEAPLLYQDNRGGWGPKHNARLSLDVRPINWGRETVTPSQASPRGVGAEEAAASPRSQAPQPLPDNGNNLNPRPPPRESEARATGPPRPTALVPIPRDGPEYVQAEEGALVSGAGAAPNAEERRVSPGRRRNDEAERLKRQSLGATAPPPQHRAPQQQPRPPLTDGGTPHRGQRPVHYAVPPAGKGAVGEMVIADLQGDWPPSPAPGGQAGFVWQPPNNDDTQSSEEEETINRQPTTTTNYQEQNAKAWVEQQRLNAELEKYKAQARKEKQLRVAEQQKKEKEAVDRLQNELARRDQIIKERDTQWKRFAEGQKSAEELKLQAQREAGEMLKAGMRAQMDDQMARMAQLEEEAREARAEVEEERKRRKAEKRRQLVREQQRREGKIFAKAIGAMSALESEMQGLTIAHEQQQRQAQMEQVQQQQGIGELQTTLMALSQQLTKQEQDSIAQLKHLEQEAFNLQMGNAKNMEAEDREVVALTETLQKLQTELAIQEEEEKMEETLKAEAEKAAAVLATMPPPQAPVFPAIDPNQTSVVAQNSWNHTSPTAPHSAAPIASVVKQQAYSARGVPDMGMYYQPQQPPPNAGYRAPRQKQQKSNRHQPPPHPQFAQQAWGSQTARTAQSGDYYVLQHPPYPQGPGASPHHAHNIPTMDRFGHPGPTATPAHPHQPRAQYQGPRPRLG